MLSHRTSRVATATVAALVATLLVASPGAHAANGDVSVVDPEVTESDELQVVNITVAAEGLGHDGTVDWTTAPNSATAGQDFLAASGTVEINENDLLGLRTTGTISVTVLGDDVPEFAEAFSIVLSNPTGGLAIPEDTWPVSVDDDDGGRVSIGDAALDEGDDDTVNRRLVARVTLMEVVDHDVTVDYDTADGTATAGEDYLARPEGDREEGNGTVTIAAGDTDAILDVRLIADTDVEDDETFTITLSNVRTPDEGRDPIILDDVATATIRNDDRPPPTVDAGDDRTVESYLPVALVADVGGESAGARVTWDLGDESDEQTGEEIMHTWTASGSYTVTVTVTDGDVEVTDQFAVTVEDRTTATRSAGATREATAVRAALDHWDEADTVLLATSRNFPDSLAAGPFAAIEDAPLLLTPPDGLPADVRSALDRLDVRRVVILGGEAAVPSAIEGDLVADGFEVERISGDSRFDTAAKLAREVGAPRDQLSDGNGERIAVLALGVADDPNRAWPDALGAGAYAMLDDPLPVLLSTSTDVPDITMDTLEAMGVTRVNLLGGPVALGGQVEAELLGAGYDVTRLAGNDRFETSVAVAEDALARLGDRRARPVFATGRNFPDGLAAGAVAARIGGPVVLVPGDDLPDGIRDFLASRADQLDDPVTLGGEVAVSATTMASTTSALTRA